MQVSLPLDTEIVLLRDRAPLHAPNVELTGGRTCEDVVVVHDLDNSVELGADVSCRLK